MQDTRPSIRLDTTPDGLCHAVVGRWSAAALAVRALIGLTGVKKRWRTTWGASHLTTATI